MEAFLQLPLLPGRDGQALRENYISAWRFVISAADMNLPEAFKTALALCQKMGISTLGSFYLSVYATHFLLDCISQAKSARVSSQHVCDNVLH